MLFKGTTTLVKLKNGHPWSKSVQHSNIETRQKEQLENVQSMSGLFFVALILMESHQHLIIE